MPSLSPDSKRGPDPRDSPTPPVPTWSLRPLTVADHPALLRLNSDNRPAVAAIESVDLPGLLAGPNPHLVAIDRRGDVLGYLLCHPHDSGFRDTEIDELRRRIAAPFFYLCQVVVSPGHRGLGIGRAFYAAVAEKARRRGTARLCCDVNTNPPNPASLAFHRRLGFRELGMGVASNGFEIVYLVKDLGEPWPMC